MQIKVSWFYIFCFILSFSFISLFGTGKDKVEKLDSLLNISSAKAYKYADSILRTDLESFELENKAKFYQTLCPVCLNLGKYNETLSHCKTALRIHRSLNDTIEIALDIYFRAEVYWKTGLYEQAEKELMTLLKLRNNVKGKLYGETLLSISRLYNEMGESIKALDYLEKTEDFLKEYPDSSMLAGVYNYQAIYYLKLSKFTKAEDAIKKAIEINIKQENDINVGINYNTLGRIYYKQQNYSKALHYYYIAFESDKEAANFDGMMIKAINLSATYYVLADYANSRKILEEIFPLANKSGNKRVLYSYYFNMAMNFRQNKQSNKAIEFYNKAKNIAKDLRNNVYLANSYKELAYLYKEKEQYKSAYRSEAKSAHYQSLVDEERFAEKMAVRDMQVKLTKAELNEKELQQELAEKEQAELHKQLKIWILLSLLILAVSSASVVYIIRNKRIRINWLNQERLQLLLEKRIQEQNDKLEQKKEQIGSLGKKIKYSKQELDQMVFLIKQSNICVQNVNNQLNILEKRGLIPSSQLSLIKSELEKNSQLLNEHVAVKYSFTNTQGDIRARIKERYNSLTKNEQEICLMLKLGFSPKEIATKNNTEYKSVEVARYRMRKKLGFETNDAFMEELMEL